MSMSRTCLIVGVTLLACDPSTAQAQQPYRPERPYRGIFAGGIDYSGQSLTANGALSAGYDDNLLADASDSSIQNQQGGAFGQAAASLNYLLNAERVSFNAAAGTSQRYYPSLQDNYFDTYHANIAGSVQVMAKPAVMKPAQATVANRLWQGTKVQRITASKPAAAKVELNGMSLSRAADATVAPGAVRQAGGGR